MPLEPQEHRDRPPTAPEVRKGETHGTGRQAVTPIRPRGVHGQTVEALASRILSGELAEGQTLDLPALREELDVSLTALREALKALTAKGMIDARQKRGTFVRPRVHCRSSAEFNHRGLAPMIESRRG